MENTDRQMRTRIRQKDRKSIGAFDTPVPLIETITNWAIRSAEDRILEPGFGGCGFIKSSITRLQTLGASNPDWSISGCDISQHAFKMLESLLNQYPDKNRYKYADFLSLVSSDFGNGGFDAIIGNPPYVRHHDLTDVQRQLAQKNGSDWFPSGKLDGKANLWAMFVMHSLQFLNKGGRMAWVLPASFLQADYAHPVREELAKKFEKKLLILFDENLFARDGASVSSVVVFCDGYDKEPTQAAGFQIARAATVAEAERTLALWKDDQPISECVPIGRSLHSALSTKIQGQIAELLDLPETKTMYELADISIGIVTGANKYFVLSDDEVDYHGLPKECTRFIFAKSRQVPGIRLSPSVVRQLKHMNERCLLFDTSYCQEIDQSVEHYLDEGISKDDREGILTFGKRAVWHQSDDYQVPDAFFTYMNNVGPRLIRNHVGANSTNSLYRIYFREGETRTRMNTACISMQTTFSQLHAEITGRSYGAGLLKHEPRDVADIALIMPSDVDNHHAYRTMSLIDHLLRRGERSAVRRVADEFILKYLPVDHPELCLTSLEGVLSDMRRRRLARVNGNA